MVWPDPSRAVIGHARRVRSYVEKELAQLAAEQQRCRQEGKRCRSSVGGETRSDMTAKRLAEIDERDHQLEQRMAELRDE